MGSCYGLLPGMAEAATTLSSMAMEDARITVDDTGTKLTVAEGDYEWSEDVTGGTGINDVTISRTTITLNAGADGGSLAAGSGSGATLTIDGSTIQTNESTWGCLYGVKADTEGASGGKLIIEGDSRVTGLARIDGGCTNSGNASNNEVTISKGTVTSGQNGLNIEGGSTMTGTASNNKVNISGGTITADEIIGGRSNSGTGGTGNSVNISGGTITQGSIYGAKAGSSNSTKNTINICGTASLASSVSLYGADYAPSGTAVVDNDLNLGYDGTTGTASSWAGGTVFGLNNFSAVNYWAIPWSKGSTYLKVTNNITNVTSFDFSNMTLTGTSTPGLGDTMTLLSVTENSTDLDSSSITAQPTQEFTVYPVTNVTGVTAVASGTVSKTTTTNTCALTYTLNNIKSITFGSGLTWATDGTLLDLSGTNYDLSATTVNTTNVSFTTTSLNSAITTDGSYKMTLLSTASASNLKASNLTTGESTFTINNALTGKGIASYSNGDIIYTINATGGSSSGTTATEQTHQALAGASAGAAATSSSAVNTTETAGMALAGVTQAAPVGDTVTFSNIGGGTNTYETGSSVTTRLWQATVGVGAKNKMRGGSMFEYAVYYEGGRGNYTTYNEHADHQYGSGRIRYNGGGIFMRYELPSRLYAETSVHTGRMNNEAENVLYDDSGKGYGYDKSSSYYGWHLGIGKIYQLSPSRTLDVYGKYYFNQNDAVSYDMNNSHFDIDAVNSKQLNLGFRLNQQHGAWKLYYGGAFNYEFDGKSTGTVSVGSLNGAIRATSTKGASGMLELGYKLEATEKNPWELDLNLRGYAGKHQGAVANIGLKYMFN